jgi:hypothetical protein
VTKAAELAKMGDVITNSQIGGRRNIVINGKFEIFQRGTSATTVSGNDVFAADRFKGWANGGGTYTVEQSTDVPNNEFEFSAKLINTAVDSSIAAGDFYVYATDIEGHNVSQLAYGSSDAKAVTLSFWVKASLAGTYCIAFYSVTASRYQIKEYTISSADTWEKKIITITSGDTTGSWNRTNGNGLRIYWDLGSGSTYQGTADTWASGQKFSTTNQANWIDTSSANFYLTGVQLEVGEVATPFEHRSFGEEMQLCQRYFVRYSRNDAFGEFFLMRTYDTTNGTAAHHLPVPMRDSPTLETSTVNSSNFSYSLSALTIGHASTNFQNVELFATGSFTANGAAVVQKANNTDEIVIDFKAEL